MKSLSTLLIALTLPTCGVAQTANNQCAPHDQIVKFLGGELGEDVIVIGQDSTYGSMMEIFTNRKSGAWTLVSKNPDGSGCYVAEGQGLVYIPPGEPA